MLYLANGQMEIKSECHINSKSILAVDAVAAIMTFIIALGKNTNP